MFAKSDINIIEHYEIYFISDQIQYFSALIFLDSIFMVK